MSLLLEEGKGPGSDKPLLSKLYGKIENIVEVCPYSVTLASLRANPEWEDSG
jgi:hypothetical protein